MEPRYGLLVISFAAPIFAGTAGASATSSAGHICRIRRKKSFARGHLHPSGDGCRTFSQTDCAKSRAAFLHVRDPGKRDGLESNKAFLASSSKDYARSSRPKHPFHTATSLLRGHHLVSWRDKAIQLYATPSGCEYSRAVSVYARLACA